MVANLQNVWRQGLVKLDNCKVFLVLSSWQSFIVGQCHLSHQALVKSGVESRRSNNGLKCMINIRNQPAPDQCQCYVKSGWSASVTRRWCGGVMDYLLQSQGRTLSVFAICEHNIITRGKWRRWHWTWSRQPQRRRWSRWSTRTFAVTAVMCCQDLHRYHQFSCHCTCPCHVN